MSPYSSFSSAHGNYIRDADLYLAMFDLANDPISHKLISEFYEHNKIISAVCHGPAALAHVKLPNGTYFLDDQQVTGFSNSEEDAVQCTEFMPFSLEDALNKASGGKYLKADENWGEKVVVSRGEKVITGQNPVSAEGVGRAIMHSILEEKREDEL